MSYNGCHRLPGFAHFDAALNISSLEPLEFKFNSSESVLDNGLDLSIVNGLDLTNTNYEGLNLSSNNGGRSESTSQNQHYSQISTKSQQPVLVQNIPQSSGQTSNQSGLVNQPEMVLNLSTRPGQELDYSNMLDIDHNSTFGTGLQGEEFEYYGNYYDNYTSSSFCNMEEQRSSPLNLEYRSSPLNLTAVGSISRKRKPTAPGVPPNQVIVSSREIQAPSSVANPSNQNSNVYFIAPSQSLTVSQPQALSCHQCPPQSNAVQLKQSRSTNLISTQASATGPGTGLADQQVTYSTNQTMDFSSSIAPTGTLVTEPINMGKFISSQDYTYPKQAHDQKLPRMSGWFFQQENNSQVDQQPFQETSNQKVTQPLNGFHQQSATLQQQPSTSKQPQQGGSQISKTVFQKPSSQKQIANSLQQKSLPQQQQPTNLKQQLPDLNQQPVNLQQQLIQTNLQQPVNFQQQQTTRLEYQPSLQQQQQQQQQGGLQRQYSLQPSVVIFDQQASSSMPTMMLKRPSVQQQPFDLQIQSSSVQQQQQQQSTTMNQQQFQQQPVNIQQKPSHVQRQPSSQLQQQVKASHQQVAPQPQQATYIPTASSNLHAVNLQEQPTNLHQPISFQQQSNNIQPTDNLQTQQPMNLQQQQQQHQNANIQLQPINLQQQPENLQLQTTNLQQTTTLQHQPTNLQQQPSTTLQQQPENLQQTYHAHQQLDGKAPTSQTSRESEFNLSFGDYDNFNGNTLVQFESTSGFDLVLYTKTSSERKGGDIFPENPASFVGFDLSLSAFEQSSINLVQSEAKSEVKHPSKVDGEPRQENKTSEAASSFTCELCKLQFVEESQLLSHNKTMHDGKQRKSGDKQQKSSRSQSKSSHPQTEAVNLSPVKNRTAASAAAAAAATTVAKPAVDLAKLKEELEKQPFPYQCYVCNEKFAQKTELHVHLEQHNEAKPFKCHICAQGFLHRSARDRHRLAHIKPKAHACTKCEKRFSRRSDLTVHMRAHNRAASSRISCQNCAQMFEREKDATKHVCSARDKEPAGYPCPICDAALPTKMEWGAHLWKHTKNAKYIVMTEDHELPEFDPEDAKKKK